jgi:hypothetical protein
MSSSTREELLAQVVELVNDAKLDLKEDQQNKLAQVLEIAMHRDTSLLPDVVPMIVDFQVSSCMLCVCLLLLRMVPTSPQDRPPSCSELPL